MTKMQDMICYKKLISTISILFAAVINTD